MEAVFCSMADQPRENNKNESAVKKWKVFYNKM
jgi:hypothetical protein